MTRTDHIRTIQSAIDAFEASTWGLAAFNGIEDILRHYAMITDATARWQDFSFDLYLAFSVARIRDRRLELLSSRHVKCDPEEGAIRYMRDCIEALRGPSRIDCTSVDIIP